MIDQCQVKNAHANAWQFSIGAGHANSLFLRI